MAEQPIFTLKAHVFQIDPETRKKWLPLSSQAVDVSFYFDSARNMYRIISLDNQKPIVNSIIVPKMNFSKTSQKFGQWADARAGTVYGLGFSSELELSKFSDKFAEIKELAKVLSTASPAPPQTTPHFNGNDHRSPTVVSTNQTENSMPTIGLREGENINDKYSHLVAEKLQLQEDNEKLRRALTESAANATKWSDELKKLRQENEDLKSVMFENSKNVEEWKKRLSAYEEERVNLSKKITELERSDQSSILLQKQLSDALSRLEISQRTTQQKQDEVLESKKKLEEVKQIEIQNKILTGKLQNLEEEKLKLRGQIQQLQQQVDDVKTNSSSGREQLKAIQQQINTKINDLYEMNDKLADIVEVL